MKIVISMCHLNLTPTILYNKKVQKFITKNI